MMPLWGATTRRWPQLPGAAWALVAACVCGLSFSSLSYWRWQRAAAPRPMICLKEAPHGAAIWGVWTGHSYAYGLEAGADGIVLVDSGSDPDASALRQALAARGYTPLQVSDIILTQGGYAQTAGLHHFPQANIWVGPADAVLARRDILPRPLGARLAARLLRQTKLPKPRLQPLWPGQQFAVGATSGTVVALPGHTPGSVAFIFSGHAFVGNSLLGAAAGPRLASRWTSASPRHNLHALGRLGAHPFHTVATASVGSLFWGRHALCTWLQAQGGSGALPAVFLRGCTATTAGNG